VAILADTLQRLCARVAALDGLDGLDGVGDDLRADVRRAAELAAGLDPYVTRMSTPESTALRELAARTAREDWGLRSAGNLEQEMLSGHLEGQTLGFLVRATGARRVLEIGMFTGYSALAMAEALPDDGEVVACEIDGEVAAFAKESLDRSPAGGRVRIRVGPALDTLAQLAASGEVFDLVFVDADKASNADYLDWSIRLSRPGTVIIVDNVVRGGAVADPAQLSPDVQGNRRLFDLLEADGRVDATAIQTVGSKGYDGFVYAVVR
jgi:caffeoyl-CoA O-methyltransferase